MNARLRKDDEISFEGLVAFDSAPPPKGAGSDEARSDVHNACTAVAELPDDFLEALKNGVKADVSRFAKKSLAANPPLVREEPEEPDEVTNLFEMPEAPTSPYGPKILSPELFAPAPTPPPPPLPSYAEPYTPAPSYAPPSHPPARLSIDTPPPMAIAGPPTVRPSVVERLWVVRRSIDRRAVVIGVVAMVACGIAIALWALLVRRLV